MIYTIGYDFSDSLPLRPGERNYDAELIRFDDYENVRLKNPKIDYTDRVPPIIEFVGELGVLEQSDFPYIGQSYLLMSRKMLEVLLSVQPFKHQVFPTRIYSYGIEELVKNLWGERTDYQVEEPSLYTDKFVIMQLKEALDILDEDKTILKCSMLYPSDDADMSTDEKFITARESGEWYFSELDVEHYEFTKDEKDLPPVFTTPKTPYFFTEAAVQALKDNHIRGVEFHPIPLHSVEAALPLNDSNR
jgi:hypothetical protein